MLGFEHRSAADQKQALERPALKDAHASEVQAIERRLRQNDNPFLFDVRLVSSDPLYRRLADMGQLMPTFSSGFQDRLSHTQHVTHIAGRIADRMHLGKRSNAISRAIAQAHDLGHPPFSHEGETVFKEEMGKHGGSWDHDAYVCQMITHLSHGGFSYDGMPVTNAMLEGLGKRFKRYHHTLEMPDHFNRPMSELDPSLLFYEKRDNALHLDKWSPIEGQIASIADWTADIVSDTRDMLMFALHTSKTPREFEAFTAQLMEQFPPAKKIWNGMQQETAHIIATSPKQRGLESKPYYARTEALITAFSNRLESYLIRDLLDNTLQNYQRLKGEIHHAEDVRNLPEPLVEFSPETYKQVTRYGEFFHKDVYPKLLETGADTVKLMRSFFTMVEQHFENPSLKKLRIDPSWRALFDSVKRNKELSNDERHYQLKKLVCGYITCNYTDRDVFYFIKRHDPELFKQEISDKNLDIYPTYAHPTSVDEFAKRLASERALNASASCVRES